MKLKWLRIRVALIVILVVVDMCASTVKYVNRRVNINKDQLGYNMQSDFINEFMFEETTHSSRQLWPEAEYGLKPFENLGTVTTNLASHRNGNTGKLTEQNNYIVTRDVGTTRSARRTLLEWSSDDAKIITKTLTPKGRAEKRSVPKSNKDNNVIRPPTRKNNVKNSLLKESNNNYSKNLTSKLHSIKNASKEHSNNVKINVKIIDSKENAEKKILKEQIDKFKMVTNNSESNYEKRPLKELDNNVKKDNISGAPVNTKIMKEQNYNNFRNLIRSTPKKIPEKIPLKEQKNNTFRSNIKTSTPNQKKSVRNLSLIEPNRSTEKVLKKSDPIGNVKGRTSKQRKFHNNIQNAVPKKNAMSEEMFNKLFKNYSNKKKAVDKLPSISQNLTNHKKNLEKSRGFFSHGGIFSLGKVLNFFPVGGERECQPDGFTVARAGICLNPYDCRQRDGKASGDCAHGLGVCCTFEVTCGGVAANNLTYFSSPSFPELWMGADECSISIEKAFAGIMQLRIDFVHFTIGQPNRMTGECNEDAMILGEGKNNFTICGQNHGQHIYYTLPTAAETREAGELPSIKSTKLRILMRGGEMPRLWLLRIAQLPLAHSAPHNCLQYHTSDNGTIKTFNFASNGRHLASQDYRACVRKNTRRCAIRYSPCDSRSFRIGVEDSTVTSPYLGATMQDPDQMMDADGSQMQDEMEGSGMDPQMDAQLNSRPTMTNTRVPKSPSWLDTIWSYIWPSWLWGQSRGARSIRWSPYLQHYKTSPENDDYRYYGYGTFGLGLHGFGRQRCRDRITIPCESEYFVSSLPYGPGVCDPHHCGSSFCPDQPHQNCRVETSITPFAVSVHFGPPIVKGSPEENIGACLRYQQMPCDT